jgi:asparagine synthase (glutamine-hydrolysing)
MCGISGMLPASAEATVDRALLARMNDSLTHRGPDGAGLFIDAGIGLGHRRLAVIDLVTGDQPLFNEDGSVVVVFNGEIYNFAELGRELAALGHVLATRSDTEVIVHAWEEWGEACVNRLQGMFAFALWDRHRQCLFLARDRLGIKPLHYATLADGTLLFASELKALLAHPDLPREIDAAAVEEYFAFGYVPDPRTILRHARKLPPGHTLCVNRGETRTAPRCYWRPHYEPRAGHNERETISSLLERLDAAVRSHLVADVPVGAFLSGGIDSSAVVAAMQRANTATVETCSIGFRETEFDESPHAAEVARHVGSRHHVETVTLDSPDRVEHLADLYDEPFADSSAIPTWHLCALARRHVTVALSGDGGDEIFAGYPWYGGHLRNERLRRRLPAVLRNAALPLLTQSLPRRYRDALGKLSMNTVDAFAYSTMISTREQRNALFSTGLQRELQGHDALEVVRDHAANAASTDVLGLAQHIDTSLYLPGDILTKVDRASMAHSLEVRVPLLDHVFVDWATTLPTDLKWRSGRGKHVLRRATEQRVPPTLLDRPKAGFSVPLAQWFRGPLRGAVDRMIEDPSAVTADYLRTDTLRDLVRAHVDRRADHSSILWACLMFDQSLRRLLR